MKMRLLQLGICGIMVAGAGADILHDTTGFGSGASWGVGSRPGSNINQPADSFSVSGGDYYLDRIVTKLNPSLNPAGDAGDYELRIWSNNVFRPGMLLESFNVPNSSELNGGNVILFSEGGVLLEEGSTYWISIALPDNTSYGSWIGVNASSLGRSVAFSNSTDTEWIQSTATNAMYLHITGTAVPEPGALAMIGIGVLVMNRRRL